MNKNEKCFSRPKVRFSQSTEPPENSRSSQAFAGPKIRSVVNFKPSMTILKAPSERNHFERSPSPEETISSRHSVGDAPNDLRHCPLKTASGSAPCLSNIVLTPENRIAKVRDLSDKKESSKTIFTENVLSRQPLEEKPIEKKQSAVEKNSAVQKDASKTSVHISNKLTKQPVKGRDSKNIFLHIKSSETQGNKENVPAAREAKKNVSTIPDNAPKRKNEVVTKAACSQTNNIQPSKASVKLTKPGVAKKLDAVTKSSTILAKNAIAKPTSIGVASHKKTLAKTIPMKKTILRNSNVGPLKVSVGPGIPRPRSLEPATRPNKPVPRSRSEILLAEKLDRPEYNSIVSTIEKWRNARKQKVVKDLDHLPSAYKQLINGKVSSALDFAANEAIYHDLVDLSIDEKRLPSRLTRSKDPEPRQRDLVPQLSDFFVPTNNEEYRRAVYVRPPSPRILDISNPYKISDRIFAWKEKLDHSL